ncbi:MAG: PAS domain-containing protein, partial [bacterium]
DTVEHIIEARNRVQLICEQLGFDITERLPLATSMFELGKWILEHDEGDVVASLRTEGDELVIEMEGISPKTHLSPQEIEELLDRSGSASIGSLKGISAIRRLMDEIDIQSLPESGTTIRAIKSRTGASRKLAKNLVSFLQEKFRSLSTPSLYEDLRAQNANIAQSLSLIEEKAQELQRKNAELNQVRQALENLNAELQEKTAELQEALLTLGDRTAELSAQNRRFGVVLEHISEGILVTDRAGTVVEVNDCFLRMFALAREQVVHMASQDLSHTLRKFSNESAPKWGADWNLLSREPTAPWSTELTTEQGSIACRSMPIAAVDPGCLGRVWVFS